MASDHEPPGIAPVSTESGIPVAVVYTGDDSCTARGLRFDEFAPRLSFHFATSELTEAAPW